MISAFELPVLGAESGCLFGRTTWISFPLEAQASPSCTLTVPVETSEPKLLGNDKNNKWNSTSSACFFVYVKLTLCSAGFTDSSLCSESIRCNLCIENGFVPLLLLEHVEMLEECLL